ncbi:long-chain fatty acid-CoA ligase [Tritrichomonas musculus]|uniref:Long-chain fatty acid-CoA ligase n=1 Tax=Tritrichomonas musculus TaxID=1915356 RepID=A0ABR2HJ15_9EUKA
MQSYMVAVVVPIESEKVSRHQILNELRETAKAHNLGPSKIPRGIVISDHELTPSTGELSPTNKLRRSVLLKNFKGQIDSEYTRITVLEEKKEKIKKDENFDYSQIYQKNLPNDKLN